MRQRCSKEIRSHPLEKKQRWQQGAAALARLPKRDQRLVTLCFLKEYTPAEVAQRSRLAESEVHRLLSQAIAWRQQALAVPARLRQPGSSAKPNKQCSLTWWSCTRKHRE